MGVSIYLEEYVYFVFLFTHKMRKSLHHTQITSASLKMLTCQSPKIIYQSPFPFLDLRIGIWDLLCIGKRFYLFDQTE